MTHFISLNEVKSKEPAYVWPNRIPVGSLTILEGQPGSNKSTVLYDVAARVTQGWEMPNCTGGLRPGNVLILQAEDDAAATIRPNLEAMGADLDRVFIWSKQSAPLRLPDDMSFIESEIGKLKAKLLIIDPITSFLGGHANSDQAIRRSLGPLATVAEQSGTAVVLVRHFKKSNAVNPLYQGAGSIALAGLARSVLQVGDDPKHADRRIIAQVKASLNALAPSLSFQPVQKNGGLTVEWLGVSDCTVDQLHATATKQDRPALEYAQYALFSILAEGPVLADEAKKLVLEAGVERRTLRRAKESLGIKSKREGFGKGSKFYWVLPDTNDLIDRLKQNELDDLLDNLIYGADETLPDGNDTSDPADWWKQGPRDDAEDSDLDGGVV